MTEETSTAGSTILPPAQHANGVVDVVVSGLLVGVAASHVGSPSWHLF